MKTNKSIICLPFILCALPLYSIAQSKEASQELSKSAKKGMLVGANLADDGNIRLTYKMKVDKKSDQVAYEDYLFDAGLAFKGMQPTKESKATNADQKVTTLAAFVGGTNSFSVMSMNLSLQQEVWERIWDYDRQAYKWGKRLSKETVKPKNSESKYKGFAEFANDDEGSQTIIASYDQDKDDNDQFVVLYITNDLSLKETKIPVSGSYSLVYCGSRASGNIFMLFAPNKGMPDTKKYIYTEFTRKAELVGKSEFNAPSPNTIIMDHREVNGDLFMSGGSTKSNDAYNQEFASYAPISNPGYSTSANKQMDKYEKKLYGTEFTNLHLLKFTNGQLVFASSTPVKSFKEKVVTPPAQRKKSVYEGKKFVIQNLAVAPNGDYLLTGQLEDKKIINGGKDISYRYYDFVCLHFDKEGTLKAQYAVEKMNDDSKSEMFQSQQNFFFSADGNTAYWEILEVKGTKGYSSFLDAFNGNTTITANYFPRVAKINLAAASISDFTILGEKGKFLMYRNHSFLTDEKNKTRYYLGHDDDYEKLWIGKYQFD